LPPGIDQDLNLEREGEGGTHGRQAATTGICHQERERERERDGKRRHCGRRHSREKKTCGREQIRIDIFRVTPCLF
jgi:hypothetical protein